MKAEYRFNKRASDLLDIEDTAVSSGPLASTLGIRVRLMAKASTSLNSDHVGLSIHMRPDEALEVAQEMYRVTFRYLSGQSGETIPDCPGPLDSAVLEHCWTMYQQGQAAVGYSPKQVFGQTLQSLAAWMQDRVSKAPLAVWYGSMPESNGKENWTAILHRGDIAEGITIARSEYPDRVRYEADRMRWMIGELDAPPTVLDYDDNKRSAHEQRLPSEISLTKKEVMQMAGYCVHGRQSHVGQRYDFTFPGKTGMQNSIFASEQEAAIAMEKQFDADVLCARALVNAVSAAGFMPKSEG